VVKQKKMKDEECTDYESTQLIEAFCSWKGKLLSSSLSSSAVEAKVIPRLSQLFTVWQFSNNFQLKSLDFKI
jgi:hypothetical protein